MYVNNNKIASIDKIYIWTFLVSFLVFIYISFDAFWLGELSLHLGADIYNPLQRYNTIARLLIITISLLFFHRKNYLKNLTFLGKILFVFSIYLLCSSLFTKDFSRSLDYIDTYMISSLWIYIYLFAYTLRLRYDIDKYLPKLIIGFCVLSIVLFLKNYFLNNQIGHVGWSYIESYYAIALVPAITLLKNKAKYILFFVIIICSIIAAKRTGLITCIFAILLYVLMIGKNFSSKIKTIIIGSILLLGLFFVLNQFMAEEIETIIGRIENIKEDEGSGRGEIYSNVYNEITNDPDFNSFLFGKGHNEVINSKGSRGFSAHNEFLEAAYDYGIIGFIIFLLVFIAILRTYLKTKIHQYKVAVFLSFVIFFVFSLTSHTILNTTNIVFLCMFWGYIDARNKIRRTMTKNNITH